MKSIPPHNFGFTVILLCFTFLFTGKVSGQGCDSTTVNLILPDTITGMTGDVVCVPIQITNFTDITIFFFSVNFNSTVLEFESANPLVSGLPSFTASDIIPPIPPNALDIIRVFWSQPNVLGETLPDSTILLELCFRIIGNPGQDGGIFLNSSGLNGVAEFTTPTGISYEPCSPNGTIVQNIPPPGPNPEGFITSLCGTSGGIDEGIVELTIFNGSPPYQVSDDMGNTTQLDAGENIFLARGLSQGTFTYTITDAMGNTSDPISVVINDNDPFSLTAALSEPDCPLENDGRISLTVEGGKPFPNNRYYFDWGPSLFGLGQREIKNVSNGSYNVTIIDSLGCKQDTVFTLNRSEIGIIPVDVSNALCDGRNNGSISVRAAGGGPFSGGRYNFTIEGTTNSGQTYFDRKDETTQANFRLLPPGEYLVVAQDSVDRRLNCPADSLIIIGVDRVIQISNEIDMVATCGPDEESRIISISSSDSAVFPFDVEIRDEEGNLIVDQEVNATDFSTGCIPAGTYTYSATDAEGCQTEIDTFTIAGCPISVSTVQINPLCPGELNGGIDLTVLPNDSIITYLWSTGDTSNQVTGLGAGQYSVTISLSEQSNCQLILDSLVLEDPPSITVSFDENPIICRGLVGNVIAMPSGGSGQYTYEWNPNPVGSAESVLAGVPTGTYTVTVTDDNGCSAIDSFLLDEPDTFEYIITNPNPPICAGDSSGTAVVQGLPTADYTGPFSYLSSSGLGGFNTAFSITNFPAGQNWVLISDGICTSDTIYIETPEQLEIELDRTNSQIPSATCFGEDDLLAVLVATGGNGTPFTFSWPDLGPNVTGNVQFGLSGGTYQVIIENSSGCQITDSIVIEEPPLLESFIDSSLSSFALCGGDNDTELVIAHTGGIEEGVFTYNWEDASGTVISTTQTASDLMPGSYFVTVTDENNCTTDASIEVIEPAPVIGVLGEVSDPNCFGELGEINIDSAYGGVGGNFRFQVNTSPAQDIPDPFNIIPGTHTVRVFDQNGCEWETEVEIGSPEEITVNIRDVAPIQLGESTVLRADISSATTIDAFAWSPDSFLQCVLNNCQEVSVMPNSDQVYQVQVTDVNGCTAIDDVLVEVQSTRNIYIPNTFSPNAIFASNQFYSVRPGAGVQVINYIRIYDRWGNLVYETENEAPSPSTGNGYWDGTFNGQAMQSGVYVVVVQVTYIDNQTETRASSLTLIR